jgi:hypothetical protein
VSVDRLLNSAVKHVKQDEPGRYIPGVLFGNPGPGNACWVIPVGESRVMCSGLGVTCLVSEPGLGGSIRPGPGYGVTKVNTIHAIGLD